MGYRLGIDLGTTFTAAAYVEDAGPRMLDLGDRNLTIPSVLFLTEEGTLLFGETAERRASSQPERVLREFKRRIGDTVPIVVGDRTFDPSALQAELLRRVLLIAEERLGGPPDHVVVTHPANWGLFKLQLMRNILAAAGIPTATLCPEPVAAAIEYAAKQRIPVGAKVAVYDLGGGTFDVAILEKTDGGFEIIGTPLGVEHLGGIDFDEAVLADAVHKLGLRDIDPDDPATAPGLAALRRDCVEAKEALSSDVTTDITSLLPGSVGHRARLTRGELQTLIRPAVEETIRTTARALRMAGVGSSDLYSLVLVGGSSRIPLVTELLNRDIAVPVAADTFPKHDIALGAARQALLCDPEPVDIPAPVDPLALVDPPVPVDPLADSPVADSSAPNPLPPDSGSPDPETVTPVAALSGALSGPAGPSTDAHPPTAVPVPRRQPRRLTVLIAAAALLAVALVTTLLWRPWQGNGNGAQGGPALEDTSLAPGTTAGPTVSPTPTPTPTNSLPVSKTLVDETFDTGEVPGDWRTFDGKWKAVDGHLQSTTGVPRSRIQIWPTSPKNFRIETTIRFVKVENDSRWLNVGLDYHVKDDWGAVLVVRSNTKADNGLELAQRKKSAKKFVSEPVKNSTISAGVGKKRQLAVDVHGKTMVVTMDGHQVFKAKNMARTGGDIGFVINKSTIQFDNVKVIELP